MISFSNQDLTFLLFYFFETNTIFIGFIIKFIKINLNQEINISSNNQINESFLAQSRCHPAKSSSSESSAAFMTAFETFCLLYSVTNLPANFC
jgi:hypothetical protein